MKKILKILGTVFGISLIGYVIAREKVLLKKTSHDCNKLAAKCFNLDDNDTFL